MIKIDLITGILGAGKTTFIKKYAKYLIASGKKIGILENDYGAVNVDLMLLQEIRGENCELEMVAGGCDKDCHKRRFKTKLISMGMSGYDRVLVEPSGIFDVDEFFDTLREDPLDRWYEIGNVIAIVDARIESDLSKSLLFLLASQLANANAVILSHASHFTKEECSVVTDRLNQVMETVGCRRRFQKEIICKDWEQLTASDFEQISQSGYVLSDYVKLSGTEEAFSSLYFMNLSLTESEVLKCVKKIMNDPGCGNVIRIKGFFGASNNSWKELNATRNSFEIRPIREGQQVFLVIGEELNEELIRSYWNPSAPPTEASWHERAD